MMTGTSMKVHLLLIVCLTILLFMQLSTVQRFDTEQPHKVHLLVERLEHLDAQSEQNMLQIYSRTLFDYDQMSRDLMKMGDAYNDLVTLLADDTVFDEKLSHLKASVQLQSQGASDFKAAYAILSNSLRYMPTLVAQLKQEKPKLHLWLMGLNRDVYQWNIYPNDRAVLQRVQIAVEQSKKLGLNELYRHLQIVLEYTPLVTDAIDLVISCGVSDNARIISESYDLLFTEKMRENQLQQVLLFIFAVVLLLYILLLLISRQRAASRLRESENRYQLLFNLIPDGVGVHRDSRWVYCNPALVAMFGASSEDELIGTHVLDRVHHELRDQVSTRIKREMEEMQPASLMLQKNIKLDGSEFFAEVQGIPFSENNCPVAMAVIRDVTDRVIAEREADNSRENLRTVIDNSAAMMYQKDVDGRYMLINRYYEGLMGVRREEVVGRTDHELFSSDLADKLHGDDLRVIEAGEVLKLQQEFELDGGQHTFITIKVPLKDGEGRVESVFGISTDITALINAERERAEAQSKIEHVQRLESLGILAGGIAHDFNNILTAVMGNAALAERSLDSGSPARAFISRIENSTQRASELCKQMLAYSGKGKFVIKPINLSVLVNEMARLMEVSIEKDVVIKYQLAENLPLIEADAAQIQQVILNLITNANEAIEGRSGIISFGTGVIHADRLYLDQTIAESNLQEGRYVYLEVSDTGKGMDSQTIKKIFDPFFTTKFTGRGLGMSAVLGIVRGHQGALRVYSEEGKGTTFKVLFPAPKQLLEVTDSESVKDEGWSAHGTVLIVDDEETIREVAGMMLEDMGFETIGAENGWEGLHHYQKHQDKIVAVLLDMTMPKMDGRECYRELRRLNPEVKVILSSGYTEQDATSRFVGKGLAGFIQKPYSPEQLQQKMRMILEDS